MGAEVAAFYGCDQIAHPLTFTEISAPITHETCPGPRWSGSTRSRSNLSAFSHHIRIARKVKAFLPHPTSFNFAAGLAATQLFTAQSIMM
jgi:hypothetical protein